MSISVNIGNVATIQFMSLRRVLFRFIDHFSKFSGLAVSQLYLVAAFCTIYEVVSRYVFNAPTQWAFEVVMVLCATAWMLSAGYITLHKRHIAINVLYLMAGDKGKWRLDLFAYIVGAIALWLLADDAIVRALESIRMSENGLSVELSPAVSLKDCSSSWRNHVFSSTFSEFISALSV